MSEQQRFRAQDLGDEIFNVLAAIWKWVALVAAIAVGTCLGLILFTLVAAGVVGNSFKGVDLRPFGSSSSSPAPLFGTSEADAHR